MTRGDLRVAEIDTGAHARITSTRNLVEWYPAWSPDGRWIAFSAAAGVDGQQSDLYKMPPYPGAEPIRLTNTPANEYSPAWRPLDPAAAR
ncbi:MAG TPA: hypothetical protein VGB51_02465 [Actinomycetota bacterium]